MKTTITESGEVTIPVELRRDMHLKPGQTLIWQRVSATECRVILPPKKKATPDPVAALSFAQRHGLESMPTNEWMKMLRAGEAE